ALYNWLLGMSWEAQKLKAVARYQYELAIKNDCTSAAGIRAAWGFARLNADLFLDDPTGQNKEAYRTRVNLDFEKVVIAANAAKTPLYDVHGCYTDWGIALEKALPPVPKELPAKLKRLLKGQITPYP